MMSKNAFMSRIKKQSPGINTFNWKVFQIEESRAGRQMFDFGIDVAVLELIWGGVFEYTS